MTDVRALEAVDSSVITERAQRVTLRSLLILATPQEVLIPKTLVLRALAQDDFGNRELLKRWI